MSYSSEYKNQINKNRNNNNAGSYYYLSEILNVFIEKQNQLCKNKIDISKLFRLEFISYAERAMEWFFEGIKIRNKRERIFVEIERKACLGPQNEVLKISIYGGQCNGYENPWFDDFELWEMKEDCFQDYCFHYKESKSDNKQLLVYRDYMCKKLNEIKPGLGDEYKKDLIKHLSNMAEDEIKRLEAKIAKIKTELDKDKKRIENCTNSPGESAQKPIKK